MCLICLEFQKNRLTIKEARRNFREMALDMNEKHRQEVQDMLDIAEELDKIHDEYYDPFYDFTYYEEGY